MRENRIADSSSKTLQYATFSQRVASRARRKKVLKLAKGNLVQRGNVWTVAKNTVEKGLCYAYAHRQLKKRTFRSLWITRINAAVRAQGMTYSQFIGKVNAKGIASTARLWPIWR